MSSYSGTAEDRLYRDSDRAILGGVCAGFARYFGLNLKVTRFLTVIAFLAAMPFAIAGYLAAVLFIPPVSRGEVDSDDERRRCWGMRRTRRARGRRKHRQAASREFQHERRVTTSVKDVRERYSVMEKRLAELEKKVTSPRYQLEQEFRRL